MLVKCPVIVPLIELQVTKCVHQKEVHVTWSVIQLETQWKNMNVWEINDSGSISLHIHVIKNQCHSFYTRVIYTYIIQHRNREQKASLGWRREGRRKANRSHKFNF